MKRADLSLGLQTQPLAVLHELSKFDLGPPIVITGAWYNGRERGFSLQVYDPKKPPVLCFAVFEHRNSDNICVLKWTNDHLYLNPPTWKDVPGYESKWDITHSVPCGRWYEMADWIYIETEKYFEKGDQK